MGEQLREQQRLQREEERLNREQAVFEHTDRCQKCEWALLLSQSGELCPEGLRLVWRWIELDTRTAA